MCFKSLIKNQKGELQLFHMSFIFPLLIIITMFILNFGFGAYAKSSTITAAREAARSYAVTHDINIARETADDIISNTLPKRSDCFSRNEDIQLSEITKDGQNFCKATVTYRVPVFCPNLPKLLNPDFKGWGDYIKVTSTAYFVKEYQPEEGVIN